MGALWTRLDRAAPLSLRPATMTLTKQAGVDANDHRFTVHYAINGGESVYAYWRRQNGADKLGAPRFYGIYRSTEPLNSAASIVGGGAMEGAFSVQDELQTAAAEWCEDGHGRTTDYRPGGALRVFVDGVEKDYAGAANGTTWTGSEIRFTSTHGLRYGALTGEAVWCEVTRETTITRAGVRSRQTRTLLLPTRISIEYVGMATVRDPTGAAPTYDAIAVDVPGAGTGITGLGPVDAGTDYGASHGAAYYRTDGTGYVATVAVATATPALANDRPDELKYYSIQTTGPVLRTPPDVQVTEARWQVYAATPALTAQLADHIAGGRNLPPRRSKGRPWRSRGMVG